MQVLHPLAYLVHNETVVDVLEDLLTDSVVQVRLHELENEVKILVVLRTDYIEEFNDVRVTQLVDDAYFAVGTLSVHGMLEGIEYFFEREGYASLAVCHLPNMTVGARPDLLGDVISCEHVLFYLLGHILKPVDLNVIDLFRPANAQ
jgi:hypothetical protein